ncbi:MAG: primase-helicase family protein, partial [Bacteroidota bacterium]
MEKPKSTNQAVYLIDGHKKDLQLLQKNFGQSAILLSDLNEQNFIENIQKIAANTVVFLVGNSWCELDMQLLENGKDVGRPFFDRLDLVTKYVEQLKTIQEKEKEFSVYFYGIKLQSLEPITKDFSQLFKECEKVKQLPKLKEEIENLAQRKSFFFTKYNITTSLSKLKGYLGIKSAAYFFEVYNDALRDKEFMYNDAVYVWDEEYGKLKTKLPKWAKNIRFIGDDFYAIVNSIDAKGVINGRRLIRRRKDTLKILHGKGFASYFKDYHYLGFGNVPDNFDYKESHSGYYNRYSKIAYEPKKGSYNNILSMFKHIFGEDKVTHNKKTLKRYQIGLDYVQMLIMEPTLPLPILVLYSVERETGKSTFPQFIKKILGTNAIKVGNKAFDSEFNEIFADKVLIWCDETLLDRKQQAEKIKDLSTSKHILVNPKGSTQYEIPFFGKFVFTSNNKKMVYVDKNSVRFWIILTPNFRTTSYVYILVQKIALICQKNADASPQSS